MSDVTRLLGALDRGDPKAAAELLPLVYDELRQLAAARMAQEAPGQTLQATALVHEAWLRLVGPSESHWNSRGHFFGAAAEAMWRILVERARRKARVRQGGQLQRVDPEQVTIATQDSDDVIMAIHDGAGKRWWWNHRRRPRLSSFATSAARRRSLKRADYGQLL